MSAWKMVPRQGFNLHVVRDSESLDYLINNRQASIDNELNGHNVTTADHVWSTWPFPGSSYGEKKNGDVVIADEICRPKVLEFLS